MHEYPAIYAVEFARLAFGLFGLFGLRSSRQSTLRFSASGTEFQCVAGSPAEARAAITETLIYWSISSNIYTTQDFRRQDGLIVALSSTSGNYGQAMQ